MPALIAGIDPGRPDAAKSAVAPVALRDAAGRAGGPPGVWLLAPNDEQEARPMIDGRPVPVFPAAQWARVPREWLAARRSAGGAGEAEYNHWPAFRSRASGHHAKRVRSWVTGRSGPISPMATGRMERTSGEVTA